MGEARGLVRHFPARLGSIIPWITLPLSISKKLDAVSFLSINFHREPWDSQQWTSIMRSISSPREDLPEKATSDHALESRQQRAQEALRSKLSIS